MLVWAILGQKHRIQIFSRRGPIITVNPQHAVISIHANHREERLKQE